MLWVVFPSMKFISLRVVQITGDGSELQALTCGLLYRRSRLRPRSAQRLYAWLLPLNLVHSVLVSKLQERARLRSAVRVRLSNLFFGCLHDCKSELRSRFHPSKKTWKKHIKTDQVKTIPSSSKSSTKLRAHAPLVLGYTTPVAMCSRINNPQQQT